VPDAEILAAGGLVERDGRHGPEVLVVHRPRYDDWSLPKGKLDPGETFEDAALREIEEETGLVCHLHEELEPVHYETHGSPKLVRYWRMTVEAGDVDEREPDDEVDELRWVTAAAAGTLLSYERDQRLVERWAEAAAG
jgi:8-oxo-dGTP diphosphatase